MGTEYSEIDIDPHDTAMTRLSGPDRHRVAEEVLAAPHRWAPPVLMATSAVLIEQGRRDEAAFWFYAGQVRARFDAHRCTDPTAAAACGALTAAFGPAVNADAFADPARLRDVVARVLAWDASAPHEYDHRWIALHGMDAVLGRPGPLSVPPAQWPALADRTRREYADGLEEVLGGA